MYTISQGDTAIETLLKKEELVRFHTRLRPDFFHQKCKAQHHGDTGQIKQWLRGNHWYQNDT